MPQLKSYLKEHRTIYTIRKYEMDHAEVDIDGLVCNRTPLGKVSSKEDLIPYIKESGFTTLEAWWNKVKEINPRTKEFWLYKVEVIK
jgi:hypothetical protein